MVDNSQQRLGVWHIATDHPDEVAVLESPDGRWTYGELAARAHQLVHTFRALGVPSDGVVAVIAPNGLLPVLVSLACNEGGFTLMLVNSYLTQPEVTAIFERAEPHLLIVHEQHAAVLDGPLGTRIRSLTRVFGVGGVAGADDLDALASDHPTTEPPARRTGGMLTYSSGSTGLPKGISRPPSDIDPTISARRAAVFGQAFDFRPFDGPHLVSTGMYHGGSNSFYMGALNVGHALVIMPRFDAGTMLELIERHRVRSAYMVPTQFHRLLQLPEDVRTGYDVSNLHSVVHSAAPCPMTVKQAMFDWWGPVIWETYGGMEGAATIAKPRRWLEKPGTVGRAVRGVRIAILDDDGNELGPNEVGYIYYETQLGFRYHRDDALTEQAHRGSRFTIGDIGHVDDDGYLFVSDRAKDMIISGGVNIFPAEIEGVLLGHPAVGDAAVVGIPDDDWGEQVLAVIELRDGIELSDTLTSDLVEHCTSRLAAYKRPRRFEFRRGLPRNDAGKLYKRTIRDEYWTDAARSI
ncbi:MAG: AMP-binding protein [Acidimicrobiales bacterium]